MKHNLNIEAEGSELILKNKEEDYDRLEKRMELVENLLADKGVRDELDKR